MQSFPVPPNNTRLGFHYFPDTTHYRASDLRVWLPHLQACNASWLILQAPGDRAIPEFFIQGLLSAAIEPVLHFIAPVEGARHDADLRILFSSYARWGVHYAILYDRPNLRTFWKATSWAQADLVERFLDRFLLTAQTCLQEGLLPVFPPLGPGGDYWDTAFLRSALRGLQRRGETHLLENLAFSTVALSTNRPLNWGSGGPQCWPAARPYFTPPQSQDQLGFRSFDWTAAILHAELGDSRPILALQACSYPIAVEDPHFEPLNLVTHARRCLAIASSLSGNPPPDTDSMERIDPIPPEVLAVNFWLLSAASDTPAASQAWITPGGAVPAVIALKQWAAGRSLPARQSAAVAQPSQPLGNPTPAESQMDITHDTTACILPPTTAAKERDAGAGHTDQPGPAQPASLHPIEHYVLLPLYSWGVADWDLEIIRDILIESHPTIGFSLAEAALAARVTVVATPLAIPDQALETLRRSGSKVERYQPSGTSLASR